MGRKQIGPGARDAAGTEACAAVGQQRGGLDNIDSREGPAVDAADAISDSIWFDQNLRRQYRLRQSSPRRRPGPLLERVAFKTSRLAEFCGQRELVAQTGHAIDDWPLVILKELVDNALDAAEEVQIAPEISVEVSTEAGEIVITDNGPGLEAETIEGVLDYSIRVSSRE